MNVTPEDYNKFNGAQFRDAKELLDQILQDGVQGVHTILDIGCGSGNVTTMLAAMIPHSRIISIDIDPAMITFAQQTTTNKSIEFIVQDISDPWSLLDPKLKSVEGKVDLIWSNRVLHWVKEEDRPLTSGTIYRLLRPGGRFYGHVTLIHNFIDYLPQEERRDILKWMKIPSYQQQEEEWRNFFGDHSMTSVLLQLEYREWTGVTDEEWATVGDTCCEYFKRFFHKEIKGDGIELMEQMKFKDLCLRAISTPIGQPIVDKLGGDRINYYGQFKLIAVK